MYTHYGISNDYDWLAWAMIDVAEHGSVCEWFDAKMVHNRDSY